MRQYISLISCASWESAMTGSTPSELHMRMWFSSDQLSMHWRTCRVEHLMEKERLFREMYVQHTSVQGSDAIVRQQRSTGSSKAMAGMRSSPQMGIENIPSPTVTTGCCLDRWDPSTSTDTQLSTDLQLLYRHWGLIINGTICVMHQSKESDVKGVQQHWTYALQTCKF